MALSDHLRELRARILKIVLILIAGGVLALVFFDQVYDLVYGPLTTAPGERCPTTPTPAADHQRARAPACCIYFKLCGFASVVLTSPLWLYQIWAFIVPGLNARERKSSRVFAAIAGPLFLAGVTLGYVTLPKGLEILIGFNPPGLTNIVDFDDYLLVLQPHAAGLRHRVRDPALRHAAQPRRARVGQVAGRPPPVDHHRRLRLRRRRDAVGRPVHDDADGGADGAAVRHLRGHRALQRPTPGRAQGREGHRPRHAVGPVTARDRTVIAVDPFDLPEALGTAEVTWSLDRRPRTAVTSCAGCSTTDRATSWRAT